MKIHYRKNKIFFGIPLIVILMGIFLMPQDAFFAYITENDIISLTNLERAKVGAGDLQQNDILARAAQKKGEDILKNQVFKHNFADKQFSEWIKDEKYEYAYVGENLAIDFATNTGVIDAWLNSQTHKKNLLNNNFTEIGVAIVEGKFKNENTTLVIQIFASPLNSLALNESGKTLSTDQYTLNQNSQLTTVQEQTISNEQENNIYYLLSDQKQLYKKFNPVSVHNAKITFYVTLFYSTVLLLIYIVQKRQQRITN